MSGSQSHASFFRSDLGVLTYLALGKLLLHLSLNGGYGYHHDELYFIACGEHLSFGYVDHAPLVPWIARLSLLLFGHSLRGLRFFPAVAGALTVFLTGLLVRRMGGGRFAQVVGALAVIIAPVFLRSGNILAIPSFEPLFWVLCSYLIVRIIQEDNAKLWPWVGLAAGIGLMNKHTMLFFGTGLVAGLAFTSQRKHFLSPWFWTAGAIAFLVFLPNLLWQMANGWPTVQFIRALNAGTMSRIPLVEFLLGQILYLHPLNAPLWLAGLGYFFLAGPGKAYRILAWIYVVVLVLLLVVKGKIYYLSPAYPALLAGGALAVARLVERRHWNWMKPATVGLIAMGGAGFAPVALPILDIDTTDRYISVLSLGAIKNSYEVTGDLHGQFGWEELVATVANVHRRLSPEDQARCTIFGCDYGVAGAIDYFGKRYGLPNAISTNLTYRLWGPGERPFDIVITVGIPRNHLDELFSEIEEAAVFAHEHRNPDDNNLLVAVCRKPKKPLLDLWPSLN